MSTWLQIDPHQAVFDVFYSGVCFYICPFRMSLISYTFPTQGLHHV